MSLISPYNFVNTRLFFQKFEKNDKKIYVKQSYLLLTWFYYLTFLKTKKNLKSLNFSVLPIRRKKYTILKAPMAHKNWSKEQIKFQFYNFKISFSSNFTDDKKIQTVNGALLFVLLSKKNFPLLETNLLFLKNYYFIFNMKDSFYFNFHFFK